MGYRQASTSFQRRVGIVIMGMGVAVAIAPLLVAFAVRRNDGRAAPLVLFAAAVLWLIGVATYRALSLAHERWRRKVLRREIADARRARLESSEAFQDRLKEQSAILDRVLQLTDTIISDGIIDPAETMAGVRLVNAHAHEALGLIDDALAEVRVETGSATFNMQPVDVRAEIENVVAPFVRSGRAIATSGPQHFAETDVAVLRLMIRSLVARGIDADAGNIDVSVARNDDVVVCTVSDDGPDRSAEGVAGLSPVSRSLALAVGGQFDYSRAFGRNQYSISLPGALNATSAKPHGDPMDVLGSRPRSQPRANPDRQPVRRSKTDAVAFATTPARRDEQTVAERRKTPVSVP